MLPWRRPIAHLNLIILFIASNFANNKGSQKHSGIIFSKNWQFSTFEVGCIKCPQARFLANTTCWDLGFASVWIPTFELTDPSIHKRSKSGRTNVFGRSVLVSTGWVSSLTFIM